MLDVLERYLDHIRTVFGRREGQERGYPGHEIEIALMRLYHMTGERKHLDLGDDSLKRAREELWGDVTARRMYVTGGFGPSASNEVFASNYDLPDDTAYAETCASVAMIFWATRMLNLDLDGRYADVMELARCRVCRGTARAASTTTISKAAAATVAGPGTRAPAAR